MLRRMIIKSVVRSYSRDLNKRARRVMKDASREMRKMNLRIPVRIVIAK